MSNTSIDPRQRDSAESNMIDQSSGDREHQSSGDQERGEFADVSAPDLHADKYNDPRVAITPRGIFLAVVVLLLGVVGAAVSIYARKTRLGESTRFWGEETILALQLGERMQLLDRSSGNFEPVELSGTPGLGLLRRALLDERSYDWKTESQRSVSEKCPAAPTDAPVCIQLKLTDPTAHRFETVEIDLELGGGWVGPSDGSKRVQVTERVQPKLRNYFKTIINVQQQQYDLRD